jgi:hypothetical protein
MSPLLLLLLPCRIFEFDCGTGSQEHFNGKEQLALLIFSVMFCVVKIYISMYCLLLVTCNYRHLLYTETSHSCRKGVVINLSCTGSKTRCKPNLSPSLTLSEYKKSFCLCLQSQHSMAQQCYTSFSPI